MDGTGCGKTQVSDCTSSTIIKLRHNLSITFGWKMANCGQQRTLLYTLLNNIWDWCVDHVLTVILVIIGIE